MKAINSTGSSGFSNEGATTTYKPIQEDAASITWKGGTRPGGDWPYLFDSRLSGGQAKYASAAAAKATLTWTGTGSRSSAPRTRGWGR